MGESGGWSDGGGPTLDMEEDRGQERVWKRAKQPQGETVEKEVLRVTTTPEEMPASVRKEEQAKEEERTDREGQRCQLEVASNADENRFGERAVVVTEMVAEVMGENGRDL